MTFEQAGAEYARLQAACREGRMRPEQFAAAVAQLRVQDAGGRWWQMESSSGRWMFWNGTAWACPAPAAPAAAPAPAAYASVPVARPAGGGGVMDAFVSVIPGVAMEAVQRGAMYKTNPMAAVQFAGPTLLSALATALAPRLGRWVVLPVVLACLAWLAWPVIAAGSGQAISTNNAGRGLVGMSMLYMIPRLWRAGRR